MTPLQYLEELEEALENKGPETCFFLLHEFMHRVISDRSPTTLVCMLIAMCKYKKRFNDFRSGQAYLLLGEYELRDGELVRKEIN